MPAESAVKYLRQSNGGQRVDTRCCNFRCQQGRTCKVHQACEVPEPPQPTSGLWSFITQLFKRIK